MTADSAALAVLAEALCPDCSHSPFDHHIAGGCVVATYGLPEDGFEPVRNCGCDYPAADALDASPQFARLISDAEARGATRAREPLMEPWGPFEMGGFEGCTDRDPAHCACATDQQPACRICGQEIKPGEMAWSRQWPCHETLPLGHRDQEWDIISWHETCPDLRAALTTGDPA